MGEGKSALPRGTKFVKGPSRYKYTAILPVGDGKNKRVNFGHKDYQQYKDTVPKNKGGGIWSRKDHLDKIRRKRYRARASKIKLKNGRYAYQKKFSPSWFSYYYLW